MHFSHSSSLRTLYCFSDAFASKYIDINSIIPSKWETGEFYIFTEVLHVQWFKQCCIREQMCAFTPLLV